MPMEIYIVRIYRRNGQERGKIAGQVETVGSGKTMPFADIHQLEKILASKPAGRTETKELPG